MVDSLDSIQSRPGAAGAACWPGSCQPSGARHGHPAGGDPECGNIYPGSIRTLWGQDGANHRREGLLGPRFKSAKPDSVGGGATTLVVASGFKERRQHESSYPRRSIAAVVCTSHISAKPASIFAGACLISRRLACSECAHSAKTPNGRDSRTNAV